MSVIYRLSRTALSDDMNMMAAVYPSFFLAVEMANGVLFLSGRLAGHLPGRTTGCPTSCVATCLSRWVAEA